MFLRANTEVETAFVLTCMSDDRHTGVLQRDSASRRGAESAPPKAKTSEPSRDGSGPSGGSGLTWTLLRFLPQRGRPNYGQDDD